MSKTIDLADIEDLAIGSTFLGTGGGGDPYIGTLLCKEAIAAHGPARMISLDELDDDDVLVVVGGIGAPTVLIEKMLSLDDLDLAVRALERRTGREATAIISFEIGGLNSVLPVGYAAARGLPVVDADGMGRAFPSLRMVTFNLHGVPCSPAAISDEHGNVALLEARDAKTVEDLARPISAAMGACANIACYTMSGAEAKKSSIPDTLTAALEVGHAIRRKDRGMMPVERLLVALRATRHYRTVYPIFEGKIIDVRRETTRGWVFGDCQIKALNSDTEAVINFQNENFALRVDGELRCVVPDLICVVDRETALPIPTEALRYGQRVMVIGCAAPDQLRTPAALAEMGPHAFGDTAAYAKIEDLMAGAGQPQPR